MNLSEKDLERLILYKLETKEDRANLVKRGLDTRVTNPEENYGVFAQSQFSLYSYGIADIFVSSLDKRDNLNIDIFELKINPLKMSDVSQVLRYQNGTYRLLKYLEDEGIVKESVYANCHVDCHLIGSDINDEMAYFINEQNQQCTSMTNIFTYSFDAFDGLTFKNLTLNEYYIEENGFEKYNDSSPMFQVIGDYLEYKHMKDNKIGAFQPEGESK